MAGVEQVLVESSRRAWTKGARQRWTVCWSQDRKPGGPSGRVL